MLFQVRCPPPPRTTWMPAPCSTTLLRSSLIVSTLPGVLSENRPILFLNPKAQDRISMQRNSSLALALALAPTGAVSAQTRLTLPTTPERTGYQETSKYEDVMTFLRAVDRASPLIRLDSMGKTFENRTMPLAVVGTVNATSANAVRAS